MNVSHKRIKYHQRRRPGHVGEVPGTINIPEGALKPIISIHSYNEKELVTSEGKGFDCIYKQLKKCKDHTHWVEIRGLGDAKLLEDIGEYMGINPLVLEDISNVHQRPKFDEYDNYVFIVSRIILFADDNDVLNYQFSALVKENIIVTFSETHTECFEGVKNRLKVGKGPIRTDGPGYMAYALTDTILDLYFVMLAKIGDSLDTIEDRLYGSVDKNVMYDTQQIKRVLILLRRSSWPERDKINDILRTDNDFIKPEVKVYLKDAYDHCIQIMDLIESYKEVTASIMDIYFSMVSNRMNEIMKVLTIISVIFIPLTFIAGIYGMNFSRVDPATNKVMPDNMPELYSAHGYYYALGIMFLIAIVQIVVFWRKGWFTRL